MTAAKLARDEARRLFHLTTSSVLELAGTEAVFSKDHRIDEATTNEDGKYTLFSSLLSSLLNWVVEIKVVKQKSWKAGESIES